MSLGNKSLAYFLILAIETTAVLADVLFYRKAICGIAGWVAGRDRRPVVLKLLVFLLSYDFDWNAVNTLEETENS